MILVKAICARVAQRINESGTEAMCVGFMRTDKLFVSFEGFSIFFSLFPNLLLFSLFLNL